MIELQRLTGMRPGEVVLTTTADLKKDGEVWIYTPSRHKTEHHDKIRAGLPRAKSPGGPATLAEGRPDRLPDQSGRGRSGCPDRDAGPSKDPGATQPAGSLEAASREGSCAAYTVTSYRRAIRSASLKAGVERWHPHQLRHSAATEIRRQFGLEASRIILGHEDVRTAQIYAEADRTRGIEIMRQIG